MSGGELPPIISYEREIERLKALLRAADELAEAALPYIEKAAPHEQLFSGEDLRNFERLSRALAHYEEARANA